MTETKITFAVWTKTTECIAVLVCPNHVTTTCYAPSQPVHSPQTSQTIQVVWTGINITQIVVQAKIIPFRMLSRSTTLAWLGLPFFWLFHLKAGQILCIMFKMLTPSGPGYILSYLLWYVFNLLLFPIFPSNHFFPLFFLFLNSKLQTFMIKF